MTTEEEMKLKLGLFLAAVILAVIALFYIRSCKGTPVVPDTRPQIPVVEKPAVNRNEQSLPPEVRPKNVKGRLRVTLTDTTTGLVTSLDILVPADDSTPIILVEEGSTNFLTIKPSYEPFRDPWVVLEPHIFIGASVGRNGVSPFAGVSLITLTRFDARAGLGADRFGGGIFAAWEFVREFNLHVKYDVVQWDNTSPSKVSVGISYRL